MNMGAKAPLDHLLSVLLMIGLLWGGIVLFRKRGAMKIVGGFMLVILSVNVLNTSNYWINGFNWLVYQQQQLFNRLEAYKRV